MTQNVQPPHINHQQPTTQWLPLPTRTVLIGLIVLLALISRFTLLGNRVMSHDEVNHVVPSYALYQGKGYVHDPVTHGPFQFHMVALTYFLFGDNDTTSRMPAALFSVAAIVFILITFPRYLGRNGALIASALFTISPFMLFYGRYTRNEGFIELIGVVLLYGILRYLETGDRLGLFLVTLATAMHFIIKETAFIYTAQAMLFLLIMFLVEARQRMKEHPAIYNRFLLFMAVAILFIFLSLGIGIIKANQAKTTNTADQTTTAEKQPAILPSTRPLTDSVNLLLVFQLGFLLAAGVFGLYGLRTLAKTLGWQAVKQIRSFSLLLLLGTLILPMLSPLPVSLLGWNPLDYSSTFSMLRTGVFILLFFLIAGAIGIWWNPMLWMQNGLLFYAVFTVFYTTFFTNPNGFLTGMVGSLGYWLSQQAEERGSQPLYYYALIQMPIYEFLASFGTLLAAYFGFRHRRLSTMPGPAPAFAPNLDAVSNRIPAFETGMKGNEELPHPEKNAEGESRSQVNAFSDAFYQQPRPVPVLGLLLFWAVTSLVAYSLAGERMPWLTVHITLPCLLAAGWGLGYLVDTTDWQRIFSKAGYLSILLLPVFLSSLTGVFKALFGAFPPFQGNTLEQLQVTNHFLLSLIAASMSLMGLLYLLRRWQLDQVFRFIITIFFIILTVLTARAAYRAAFITFDDATEYLVYAHAAPAPKEVLQQVEIISRQTVGEKAIHIAYGGEALYPYWWYLRDFPNNRYFGNTPTRDLRDNTVIIVGEDLFDQMKPILGDEYLQFEYVRLWWPNQDYLNLTWDQVWDAIANPQMRSAILQIWLNRDYQAYATLTNQTAQFAPETWQPARRMRVYIRKDVAAQIWSFGAALASPGKVDPYAKGIVDLKPVQVIGSAGSQPGQFQAPRSIKIAPDGSLYVADSRNHRIQHLASDGSVLGVWGVFADVSQGEAPGGTFNEPWDVAIGKDGSVYVADTWNHRVQKFTPDGSFILMWGYFGQGEAPEAFWGPRSLAVDPQGRLFVIDTGNKRVVIFDADGNYITQFGSAGSQPGQMDEPVGVAIDSQGNVYIADTWNLRIQVFSSIGPGGKTFQFTRAWDIAGWLGQSLENKPFLAINPISGNVLVTDPQAARVLEFDKNGAFLRGWGNQSNDPMGLVRNVSGIAVDTDESIWVTDAINQNLFFFQ